MTAKTKDYYEKNLPLSDLKDLLQKYSAIGDNSMRAWFTSNHDENTWNGTEYEKYGLLAKPLAVFSVTWNGVPLIYNGQELPLKTKRLEFFTKDPIPWNGTYELHDFYKTLLNLKSENPALRGGDPAVTTYLLKTSADDKIMAYLRKNGKDEVLTVLNMSKDAVTFKITDNMITGNFKNVFEKTSRDFSQDKGFVLKAGDYAVFER